MGDNGVIQAKVNVSNFNELNFIGNAAGKDAIGKKIDRHFGKLIDRVVSQEKNGNLDDMTRRIRTGEGLTLEQHEDLQKIAATLSPKELKHLVDKGKISEESANLLIMANALNDAGLSGDAMGRGLANFFGMPPEVQQYCIETMSDRSFTRSVKAENKSSFAGLFRQDSVKFKAKEEDLNPAQQRLATYLSVPRNGPANVHHFVGGNFDNSRDTLAAAFGQLPTFRNLSPEQQTGLIDYFHELGAGGRPHHGGRPGEGGARPQGAGIRGPEYFERLGLEKNEIVDLATLMFQVMADRVSAMDQQVRVYAEGVQQKNNELKTINNAMSAVRQASADTKKANLTNVTFEDASGKSMLLSDFLTEKSVNDDPSKLKKMDSNEVNSLLASLKEKADVLSSESTQAMTKLQQAMDKYNQATTTQTNIESKFNSLQMSVRRNLAQ